MLPAVAEPMFTAPWMLSTTWLFFTLLELLLSALRVESVAESWSELLRVRLVLLLVAVL